MHAKTQTLVGLTLAVLAGVTALARAAEGTEAPGTKARLYTNADLKKFGPEDGGVVVRREAAPRMDEAAAWAFVQASLDREAARLEAERLHALELEALRSGAHDPEADGGGYLSAPWACGLGFGFDPHRRHPRGHRIDPHRAGPPLRDFLSRRETLHGRPSAEHTGHGRYGRLKGADAFPGGKAHRGHR